MANIDDKSVKLDPKADFVMEGHVYTQNDGDREVIPYYVDTPGNVVQFSDVGRGNEDRMKIADFLKAFTDTGGTDSPRLAEKASKK
jgi:hypothetical protein